jgi:hypothetical protein
LIGQGIADALNSVAQPTVRSAYSDYSDGQLVVAGSRLQTAMDLGSLYYQPGDLTAERVLEIVVIASLSTARDLIMEETTEPWPDPTAQSVIDLRVTSEVVTAHFVPIGGGAIVDLTIWSAATASAAP